MAFVVKVAWAIASVISHLFQRIPGMKLHVGMAVLEESDEETFGSYTRYKT